MSELEIELMKTKTYMSDIVEVNWNKRPTIILVAVRDKEEAEQLNKRSDEKKLPFFYVYIGQGIRGLNYGGSRPKLLSINYEVKNDVERNWTEQDLLPVMDYDYILI